MSQVIIGLGSVARVGKDTAAAALVRDMGFKRVGFADALKNLALDADPLITPAGTPTVNTSAGRGRLSWIVRGSSWEQAKDQWPEVRMFLQKLGVAVRNNLGEDTWADVVRRQLEAEPYRDFVISDVRFPNEAQMVRDLGGVTVEIRRTGYAGIGHISETALADWDWDHVIDNDSSVVELEKKIVAFVKGLKQGAPPDVLAA